MKEEEEPKIELSRKDRTEQVNQLGDPFEKTRIEKEAPRPSLENPITGLIKGSSLDIKFQTAKDHLEQETTKRAFLTRQIESTGLARQLDPLDKSQKREFIIQPKSAGSEESDLVFPIGLLPQFQLRKSEFKYEDDESFKRLKPHLKELSKLPEKISQEGKLTAGESKGLNDALARLEESPDGREALSNALHLARLYQHLRYIEEAKKATMFALGIDPDNQLGKQLFKELERVHPADIATSHIVPQVSPLSKSVLRNRILNLSGGKVIVVGDLLIDRLLEGRPERISREAPVLILEHVNTEHIPGGAANTAHNVTALGGKCHAVGVCGEDEFAPKLAEVLELHGVTHSLVHDKSRPTTVKTRIISKSHSLLQQLLRIDRISHEPISQEVEAELISRIERATDWANAIILSDYKAGVITDGVIAAVRKMAEERNTMVIVDAQGRFERFQHCTLMTPNQPDAEAAAGFHIDSHESLLRLGELLLETSGVKALLVTRGPEGMVLFEKGKQPFEIPAFNRSEVFDVTGAGDTVVATMALALTSGASMPEAMALGNLAASIVVRKAGTAVTNQKEMLDHLDKLNIAD